VINLGLQVISVSTTDPNQLYSLQITDPNAITGVSFTSGAQSLSLDKGTFSATTLQYALNPSAYISTTSVSVTWKAMIGTVMSACKGSTATFSACSTGSICSSGSSGCQSNAIFSATSTSSTVPATVSFNWGGLVQGGAQWITVALISPHLDASQAYSFQMVNAYAITFIGVTCDSAVTDPTPFVSTTKAYTVTLTLYNPSCTVSVSAASE
jgi:hypothetical protein